MERERKQPQEALKSIQSNFHDSDDFGWNYNNACDALKDKDNKFCR